MKIVRHRLHADDGTPVPFRRSPNQSGDLVPKYLIMHYTAGSSAESSIAHMLKPSAKASAHLLIGRDGAVTQLVAFNKVAWHAGQSRWHGINGLNRHSIGIELDNAGKLELQGGAWRSWFGRVYPEEEMTIAAHKHDDIERGWHLYSEAQLAVATEVAEAIMAHYQLLDVLGHDDIAPNRKRDPGPAFPMASFRARVSNRSDDQPVRFEARTRLNIRGGPGVHYAKVQPDPLDKGTVLELQSRDGSWCFVEVLDDDDDPNLTGWVHGDYISPV